MKKLVRTALIAGFGLALMQASAGTAAAAQCMTAGGVGIGVFEGFASFMAEAAMKNSAKARLGTDAPKIGKIDTKCQWKTVNFECHARAGLQVARPATVRPSPTRPEAAPGS
jgi:hypothetical protein